MAAPPIYLDYNATTPPILASSFAVRALVAWVAVVADLRPARRPAASLLTDVLGKLAAGWTQVRLDELPPPRWRLPEATTRARLGTDPAPGDRLTWRGPRRTAATRATLDLGRPAAATEWRSGAVSHYLRLKGAAPFGVAGLSRRRKRRGDLHPSLSAKAAQGLAAFPPRQGAHR